MMGKKEREREKINIKIVGPIDRQTDRCMNGRTDG